MKNMIIRFKLRQIRSLIKQQRYHEAYRAIAELGDHPSAQVLLTKLNKLAPPPIPDTEAQMPAKQYILEHWLNVERIVGLVIVLLLTLFIGYILFAALAGTEITSFVWLVIILGLAFAVFNILIVLNKKWLLEYVTILKRTNAKRAALISGLTVVLAPLLLLPIGLTLEAVVLCQIIGVLGAILWWWRAKQAIKLD